jgi:hypothetical protein
LAGGVLCGAPLKPEAWQLDPDETYGGRSVIENGALIFWTETPLAPPQTEENDQQIFYYQGFVPRSGPYSLQIRVRLPETLFAPQNPDAELIPFYSLGLVASGLQVVGEDADEDSPFLQATIVYTDLPDYGLSRGEVVILWKDDGDEPLFVRLDGAPHLLDLKITYDGAAEVGSWYKRAEEDTWHLAGTQAVQLRGGSSGRAGIGGQASNLLVPRDQAGAIVDFQVQCVPPHITGLSHQPAGNSWTLQWQAEPAATYSVWHSDDLRQWEQLSALIVSDGKTATFIHHLAMGTVRHFYQVRRE